MWFQQGAVINEATGHIEAENGSLMVFETGNAIANLGLLEAITGSEFDVKDSEITNSGTGALGILIDATSELLVDAASLKFDGTGQVALIGGTITGAAANAGNELENFDNTIVGTGTISNVQLVNDAAGIINATGGTLILNTGATIDNAGLLEATLGGTLDVKDSEITNSGTGALGIVIDATSELLVDAASLKLDGTGRVSLIGGTITGQAASAGNELENFDNTIVGTGAISNIDLDNDAAGIINATGGTLILNTGATVDNAGLLEATVSGTLDVKDSEINNSGTGPLGIVIDATSELLVDVASLKLDGAGQVSLIGGTITGQAASAGNELNNFDNTIVGTGTISNIDLDNDAAGIIHVTGGTLILNTGTTIDNAGLLEATLGGTLDVKDSEINNSGTGALGIVIDATSKLLVDAASLALDGGGQVSLTASTITGAAPSAGDELENVDNTIVGTGTISNIHLVNDAAGIIHVTGGTLVLNTGATIDNAGLLEATVSGELDVKDSEIDNSGAGTLGIVIDATSELLVDVASLTLDGGGQVSLIGGIITGQAASSGNELNNLDNTIVGTGTISNIDLDNAGTIDATGGTLILTTGTTIDNSGLLEATSGGTLDVKDGEINNSGTGGARHRRRRRLQASDRRRFAQARRRRPGVAHRRHHYRSGCRLRQRAQQRRQHHRRLRHHFQYPPRQRRRRHYRRHRRHADPQYRRHDQQCRPAGGDVGRHARRQGHHDRQHRHRRARHRRRRRLQTAGRRCFAQARGRRPGVAHRRHPHRSGADAGNELENVNNTIVGFGTISNIDLDNDVAGIINATGGTLTLATGTVIDNAGLLEATSHGVLDVKDSEINNTGTSTAGTGIVIDGTSTLLVDVGVLKLDGGGTVTLEGTITGAAPNAGNELEDVDNPITATGPAATISNLHFVNDTTLLVTDGTLTLLDDSGDQHRRHDHDRQHRYARPDRWRHY